VRRVDEGGHDTCGSVGRGKAACTAQQQVLCLVVGELMVWVPDPVAIHHPNQQKLHVYRFCLLDSI
jgi:hypothetical protein